MIEEIKLKSYSHACHLLLGDRFCSTVPVYRLLFFSQKLGRYVFVNSCCFYPLDMARFILLEEQSCFPGVSFILQRYDRRFN